MRVVLWCSAERPEGDLVARSTREPERSERAGNTQRYVKPGPRGKGFSPGNETAAESVCFFTSLSLLSYWNLFILFYLKNIFLVH